MLKDISNFDNLSDYHGIFNAALLADIIIIFLLYYTKVFGAPETLKEWYEKYRLSAVIADVFILIIGMILGRIFYKKLFNKWNFIKFSLLILVIQIIHDLLFYFLIIKPISPDTNNMLSLFKRYADEVSYGAVLGDSFMMFITVLFSSIFANLSTNHNIILSVILMYILPYILYTK
uniref:Uncharacterized protein n=1 Tax=Megaviridae environmental sample TaxID=1737588 RepID=A0A5J6VKL4_9VIRU|nr:MAG: hypothetical protein [Megaviridae environmental sample]